MTKDHSAKVLTEASPRRWWERPVGIVALNILSAVVSGLVVWLVSRHYDKPMPSTASQETRSQPQPQPTQQSPTSTRATAPASQAAPAKQPPSQTTKVKVTGNNNVAGNNVAGNGNVVGSNNHVNTVPVQVSAPHGIAIGGGVVNNPTVNNVGLPDRHLAPEQRDAIVAALQGKECKITMGALTSVEDAMEYASELRTAFRQAGCTVSDYTLQLINSEGGWFGIKVVYHDEVKHAEGEAVYSSPDSPEGIILHALDLAQIPTVVGGNSSTEAGMVEVAVGRQVK